MMPFFLRASLLLSLFATSPLSTSNAADRVWLSPSHSEASGWYPKAIQTIVGEVTRFDKEGLTIRQIGDEKESSFAADRVIWIAPNEVSEKQSIAIGLFEEKKFDEALRALLESLSERPPIWRQQWLSMLAAQAAWRNGQTAIALELVSQLDRRSLPPLVVAFLPLAWNSSRVEPSAVADAEKRLNDPSPAVRLVAASWLLTTQKRSEANAILKTLTADSERPDLAKLAEALRWRTAAPPEIEKLADQWQEKLDEMPMVLQVGPTITLIEKFETAGLDREAKRLRASLELTPIHVHPEIAR